jgi:transketolase
MHIYTMIGDGESQEGMVWEASMAAAHYKLDNLTVILDDNGLQIDGSNDEVMSLGDIKAKAEAFGYDVIEVADGNDMKQILAALKAPPCPGKPRYILMNTLKGKGDKATFTFTIKNDGDVNADITPKLNASLGNTQPDYFTVTSDWDGATKALNAGAEITYTITVELIKTPTETISGSFLVELTAISK